MAAKLKSLHYTLVMYTLTSSTCYHVTQSDVAISSHCAGLLTATVRCPAAATCLQHSGIAFPVNWRWHMAVHDMLVTFVIIEVR